MAAKKKFPEVGNTSRVNHLHTSAASGFCCDAYFFLPVSRMLKLFEARKWFVIWMI